MHEAEQKEPEILSLTGRDKPDKIIQVSEGLSCDPIYLAFKGDEWCKVVAFGRHTQGMVVLYTLRPKNVFSRINAIPRKIQDNGKIISVNNPPLRDILVS